MNATATVSKKVRLLARVTHDGYLLGATDDFENGWRESFWSDFSDGKSTEGHQTLEIEVPEEMSKALLDHGTESQDYSDGYEAWDDVLHRGRIPENGTEFDE